MSASGNITSNVNAAQVPPAFGIVAGAMGRLLYPLASASPFSVPILITKKNYQYAVNGLLTYNFDFMLSIEASDGTYTRAA